MTATRAEIIDTFLSTPKHPAPTYWDVDGDTYINGVILTLDRNHFMGYLLEIVEGSTSVVSYLTVVTFYGPDLNGYTQHDAEWWPENAGELFDKEFDLYKVSQWAMTKMFGLIESWQDRQKSNSTIKLKVF